MIPKWFHHLEDKLWLDLGMLDLGFGTLYLGYEFSLSWDM